ncbi:metal ABC transporter permease [Egicoccus halophilus]|uniref:ABC transporter permease n=1 Tax=Egicoccus halophilus TaxID=1670830 RepID=A0A8J3ACB8_9ACTN|nr:metal ABC transporter permease [Egicoccus halophilus]GGI08312.1 ABC transporter permease [Egicoccus halophilus]
MTLLTEPFAYAFFTRAVVAGVLVGAMCGALSVFVVLRRMSYIGHGLSHAVVGGVAVAVALDRSLYLGAAVATVISALLIDRVARRRGLHADASIGIVTTAIFALGVLVVSLVPVRVNLEAVLFGNVLGVTRADLFVAGGVGTALLLVLLRWWKVFVGVTFDPQVSRVHGVPTQAVELAFNLLVAAVVVASIRVLGVLLIAAAVVIPGALSRLVSRSIGAMALLAVATGVLASLVGLYGSFHLNVPSGPAIVLVGAVAFLATYLATSLAARRRVRRARVAAAPTPS